MTHFFGRLLDFEEGLLDEFGFACPDDEGLVDECVEGDVLRVWIEFERDGKMILKMYER